MIEPVMNGNPQGNTWTWRKILVVAFAAVGFFVVACCVIAAFIRTPTTTTNEQAPNEPTAVVEQRDSDASTDQIVATSAPVQATETAVVLPTAVPATAVPVAVEPGLSRRLPAPLNTEYRGKTWSAVIIDVQRGESANKQIAEANMFNQAPPQGYEYVLVTMKLTNISTENKAEDAGMAVNVKMTGGNNRLYGSAMAVPPKPFEGSLFPNGSVEGQYVLLAPSDETNRIFVVQESFSIQGPMYLAYDENASITPATAAVVADTMQGLTRESPASLNTQVVVNPVAFTVNEVIRGADAASMVQKANQFNDPAPAGTEYVCIRITLKYYGDTDPDSTYSTLFAMNEWRIIGSKNVLYDAPSVVAPEPQFSGMGTDSIYAGAEISGWIVRSVATDDTNLVLQYQPAFDLLNVATRYIALQ